MLPTLASTRKHLISGDGQLWPKNEEDQYLHISPQIRFLGKARVRGF
jgi:hypothetical protein